jgi:outer membrane protein insertion porin family
MSAPRATNSSSGSSPPEHSRNLKHRISSLSRAVALAAALFSGGAVAAGHVHAQDPQQLLQEGPVLISRIEVVGNQRVAGATIQGEAGIQPGDSVLYPDIERAIRRLWAMRQFQDVTVRITYDLDQPDAPYGLRYEVVEQPMVADIQFRGLQNVRPAAVRDTVGLRAGRPYDPAAVTAAAAMVRRLLSDRGILLRGISHELEEIPERPGEYRLIFDVEEGHRVAIAEIGFQGNTVFTDAQLQRILGTKTEGFFWFRPGTFDEARLREDLRARLPDFYAQHGYIDFVVAGDTLIVDDVTGKARLVIQLEEGAQYRLGNFEIRNNRRFAAEDLRRFVEQERGGLLRALGISIGGGAARPVDGEVFDRVAFDHGAAQVEQLYRNQGYLYARIDPVVERVPATQPNESPSVNVAWEITEGQPAYITRINIAGNTFTHEDVIRGQLMVIPGDVYSEELLIESYRRISALGFFETPLPFPNIQPDERTGDVEITFEVRERQTGSINFGTALGGGTGLAGFLGYDQPNLFGQAKSGHLRWEFGRFSNNFEASYSDPMIMGSLVSGSLSLFSSRDRFFTFQEGRRRRTGAGLRAGLPLPTDPRYSRFTVGYSLSRTTYEEFDQADAQSIFSLPPGVQSTVSLGMQRSTIDHPIFPTIGTRTEFEVALSGGPLGGDGQFAKYTLGGAWYVPVGSLGGAEPGARPIRFTLGLNAEMGAIVGDASRFPFDRFWMGGVQFGRPLRGYDETTVTPFGYIGRGVQVPLEQRFGDAYMRLSAEYAMRVSDNISLGLFYDAGNVWREPREINPMRLARGAGIGVTLITPFGPLGLDYAYGFDRDQPGWQMHFKFGQGF